MSSGFTRTPTGIVGSRYFFPNPIIWVEGPSDIYFYEPITGGSNCVLKPFHGAKNANALIEGLENDSYEYPYAVILDGDYTILAPKRSSHRWIIWLRRYSFENYLWEKDTLNRSCLKHAQCGEPIDALGNELERLERHIQAVCQEVIEMDVAARSSNPAPDVLPERVELLLERNNRPDLCALKIAQLKTNVSSMIDQQSLILAKRRITGYLKSGRITWLLNGHILFGIIQRVFTETTERLRGKKVMLNDDGLMQLLSEMVWRFPPTEEHHRLRRKIRSVVRELRLSAKPRPVAG